MRANNKKFSMKKLSIAVGVLAFSILSAILIIILNFAKKEKTPDVLQNVTKVGVILHGEKNDNNWNQAHFDALTRVSGKLNLEIEVSENTATDDSCSDVIKGLVEDSGCSIIIGTSYEYVKYIEKAAADYPDRYFLNLNGENVSKNLGAFFGRMYQTRYLSGIVAGASTKTGHIGCVSSYPISETVRGVNAFTLGVRSVNPDAVVHVIYCGSWNDDNAAGESTEKLINEYGADVISMQTDSLEPMRIAEEKGVWAIGNNFDTSEMFPKSFLTACEWHWDEYYSEKILLCKQGKFRGTSEWLGFESGIVKLTELDKTKNASVDCRKPLEMAERKFKERTFDVFYGPIKDSSGNIRIAEGESMSDENMMFHFEWYVEGVEIAN